MVLQDLFAIVDPKVFAVEYLSRQEDGGKAVPLEIATARFKEIFEDLASRDIVTSGYILLGCDIIEIYGQQHRAMLFKKQDILDFEFDDIVIPQIEEIDNLSTEQLDSILHGFSLPSSYGYEFDERNEILGYEVSEANIKFYGLEKFLVCAFEEMFFFGTEENMHKEKELLLESIKEMERIKQLPEEEQAKYFHSAEEVFDELDLPQNTPEEEEAEHRKTLVELVKNNIAIYNTLVEYKRQL